MISLVDLYAKARRRLVQPGQPPLVDKQTWAGDPAFGDFIRFLADTALSRGMEITSCAETIDLRPYGIRPGKCVDDDLLRRLFGIDVPAKKDPSQRPQCKLRAQQGHRRLQYVSVRLPILLRHSRLEPRGGATRHDPSAAYLGAERERRRHR